MKIAEINKILVDPKMQNKNTNFKIIDNRRSKLDLIIERLDQIDKRLDNLVSKNNLKE